LGDRRHKKDQAVELAALEKKKKKKRIEYTIRIWVKKRIPGMSKKKKGREGGALHREQTLKRKKNRKEGGGEGGIKERKHNVMKERKTQNLTKHTSRRLSHRGGGQA